MKKLKQNIRKILRIDLAEQNKKLLEENKMLKDNEDKISIVHESDMICIKKLLNENHNIKKQNKCLLDSVNSGDNERIKLMDIIRKTNHLKSI